MPGELQIDIVDVATSRAAKPGLNCVLGVEPTTGRLKWCPNCKYIKYLLLLPAIMLPIIVFIILSVQLNLAHGLKLLSQSGAYHMADNESIDVRLLRPAGWRPSDASSPSPVYEPQHQQQQQQQQPSKQPPRQTQWNCPRARIKHIPTESFDIHEKEILRDVRTSFIPADKNRRLLDNMWCVGGGRDDNNGNDADTASNSNIEQYATTADSINSRDTITDMTTPNEAINFNQNEDNDASLDTATMYQHHQRRRRRTDSNQNETQPNNENIVASSNDGSPSVKGISGEQQPIVLTQRNINGNESNAEQRTNGPIVLQPFWNGETTTEQIRANQMEVMKQYMDLSVEPCDDFYQYACGNWEKLNTIPRDKAGFDTFEILRESLDVVLSDLLTENSDDGQGDDETMRNAEVKDDSTASATTPYSLEKVTALVTNNNNDGVLQHQHIPDVGNNSIETASIVPSTGSQENGIPPQILNRSTTSDYIRRSRRISIVNQTRHTGVPTADVSSTRSTAEEKARHLFASCMNDEVLNKRGIEPLLKLLRSLGGWPVLDDNWNASAFDWIKLAGELRLYNNDVFIMQWVGPDIKNSDEYIIQFDQTSLGLPTRDYFLQQSNAQYLQAYQEYALNVMTLLGGSPNASATVAAKIVAFETSLARIMAAPEDRNNVTQLYNRMSIGSLQEAVPSIDWKRYLETVLERDVCVNETVVMFAMKFMQDLVTLLNTTDRHTIANYMFWKFVRHRINNLDDRFQDAKQRFYMVLIGREQSPPRWKTCVNHVNSNMGMAVGAMFVRRYFDEQSKQDTLAMTKELQDAFRNILNDTSWIDASTKHLAELKVTGMSLKIGYPDFILQSDELDAKYETLVIHPEEYFENVLRILQHLTRTEQSKLAEVVNKTAWNTAPAIVNAYYSRNKNQIMFPAGILQPPFYHRHFPRSLNFGGIGVVIGHELTHGFDDKGRLFDREGNLNRWWSEKSIVGFHQRANCLVTQYGNYTMSELGGLAIDGSITQGENIADNGGIKQAFRAYQKWLANHCHTDECLQQELMPGIDLNHLQLFFLNFAQVWCGAMRPEATKNKMKTAVHSPGRFRVIGKCKALVLVYFDADGLNEF